MNPSERINLIQGIVEELLQSEWSVIDLTLRQFDLPTDSWVGNKYSYLIRMIENASNETLSQLQQHLTGEDSTIDEPSSLSFWQPGTFRVFISHKDRKRAV